MGAERIPYDPEAHGAECSRCPLRSLREGDPVPAEWPEHPLALLVGEAPGREEVERGRPFVGRAGLELMAGLNAVGIRRSQIALTNTVACRPPENKYELFLHRIQQQNRKRLRADPDAELLPTPAQCCAPRLRAELAALPNVIVLGGTAHNAVLGPGSIMELRGGPREVEVGGDGFAGLAPATPLRVLPTLHPSFVMRKKRWRAAFRADLARAFRWFGSGLAWREPRALYAPRPEQLRQFLETVAKPASLSVFDVETFAGYPDHFEPMADRLKCLGIGVADGRAAVVPFRSVEPSGGGWYSRTEQAEIIGLLRYYLASPSFKKGGWNSRSYDRMVLESQLGIIPAPQIDGIVAHRVAEPELPHNLGYAGSVFTDVGKWKAGRVGVDAERDIDLWKYCLTDCTVAAMSIPPLVEAARRRQQDHLIPIFHKLQDICVGLHQAGLPVDQAKRREWDAKLLKQADAHRKKIRELSGRSSLNPASFPQLSDLLFDELSIAPHHFTDLGDPSTDDDALRAFLSSTWGLDERARTIVSTIRDFRRVTKRRGVVVRLRPITEARFAGEELVDFSDETEEERSERFERMRRGKTLAPGLVLPDGRVHADWNAGGTTGWRFSSSNPNCQNLELPLRDIFRAPEGYVFVACDEAQLELRMVAGLAGAEYYLSKFRSGADPHWDLCVDTFGGPFLNAAPEQQKKLRRCTKELTYGSLYLAEDPTKLEIITSAEDENEQLLFPDFTLREVAAFSSAWLRRNPEIEAWWASLVAEQRRQGYLAEPVFGLKCDFLDGPGSEGFENRLAAYKPQSGGAALVHKATFRLQDRWAREFGTSLPLVHQGHDSLVLLVREEIAARTAEIIEECMGEDGKQYGMDVKFVGETKIGRTLREV